ncbi:MAG TPA: hypothetical protein PKA88_07385 [Polyangiaceae bacterium]|mgnify:CR=1 FL=1|nr:hypothetical protein [Polyangiaceae bacterium]
MNDLGPDARALIDLARDGDAPSIEDRRRVRRAVLVAVSTGVGAGGLTAAAGAKAALKSASVAGASAGAAGAAETVAAGALGSGVAKISAWLFVGGALGLGVAVPVIQSQSAQAPHAAGTTMPRQASPQAPQPQSAEAQALGTKTTAGQAPEGAAVQEPSAAPKALVQRTPRASTSGGGHAAAPQQRATQARPSAPNPHSVALGETPKDSLSAESALLAQAQRDLASGDSTRALATLDAHAKRFPGGALSPERDAARVIALCNAGAQEKARKLAAAFLAAHPSSPLAPRVRAACVE